MMLRSLRTGQSGVSMIELMIASFVAMVALIVVIVWVTAATRVDLDQEADFEALNELRFAKSQMSKELRFADGVLTASNADSVEVWVDVDGNGSGPDSTGEQVIWRIFGDTLIRYVDDDLGTAVTWAEGLDTTNSSLAMNGNTAEIELTIAVDQGAGGNPQERTIKTQVTVRNA